MSAEKHNQMPAATEGCAAAAGYVAAWSAWPSLDIDGNITGRNLRCERCGWQTTYTTGRRKAATKKHTCPHTATLSHEEGGKEQP